MGSFNQGMSEVNTSTQRLCERVMYGQVWSVLIHSEYDVFVVVFVLVLYKRAVPCGKVSIKPCEC